MTCSFVWFFWARQPDHKAGHRGRQGVPECNSERTARGVRGPRDEDVACLRRDSRRAGTKAFALFGHR